MSRRRLVVTGGGRGVGAATARLAAARGYDVAIGYRARADAAAEVVRAVEAAGGRALAEAGDGADAGAVARLFEAAEAEFGGLDAVVVNAGVVGPRMALADMTPERIARMVAVNVTGALFTAREAARRLPEGGAIVIVSSVAARLGSPGEYVDYAATKGAMDTLTIGLAKELGPRRIRVNAVRPGLIETEIHAESGWPERARVLGAATPLGRPGTAEEVAEAILWLLSDAAAYVTGALLDVAGGR